MRDDSYNHALLEVLSEVMLAEAAREVCFKQAANHTALLKAMMKPITWLGGA
jgi:undecaprenyl phosphate-alpha-L-ara4N flippase subunit ArnE